MSQWEMWIKRTMSPTRNVYEEHCLHSMYSHGLRCMFYTVQWTVADGGPSLRLCDSTYYFYTVVSK